MVKKIITDISEEDFRKLDLVGYRLTKVKDPLTNSTSYVQKRVSLNEELDNNIRYLLDEGTEEGKDALTLPITIAIHNDNDKDEHDETMFGYFDKFMNRFSPPKTFEIGIGIKHLYSTRDYYEDREDYWRVNKRATKRIYRITLDPKWWKAFVVKVRKRLIKSTINDNSITNFVAMEKLDPTTGVYNVESYYLETIEANRTIFVKCDANGEAIKDDKH